MKKRLLLFSAILLLVSGCAQNRPTVQYPYEVKKGAKTVSYYDTIDKLAIDDFHVIDNDTRWTDGFSDSDSEILIDENGTIRKIRIIDSSITTYRSISVGDSIDKIESSFEYEAQDYYTSYLVLFDGTTEKNPTDSNKEDDWIWIVYETDGSVITVISIYDVKYGMYPF